MRRACWRLRISIHALHEESDQRMMYHKVWRIFQSTLSMRRATVVDGGPVGRVDISIHALHEESDRMSKEPHWPPANFNPRSP